MKCVHCDAELPIRAEHCYRCGKKIVADFDTLAASVHEDADKERASKVSGYLKWVILAFLVLGVLVYGVNDLFDQPLRYDGSGLPAVNMQASVDLKGPADVEKSYTDPRPNPTLPEPKITAFGYRVSPIKERLRSACKGDGPGVSEDPKQRLSAPAAAIANGLKWLAGNQQGDGYWVVQVAKQEDQWNTREHQYGHVGVTSLVLLAFLGEGETWKLDDPNRKVSPYGDKMLRAVKFLVHSQDPETGRFRSWDLTTKTFAPREAEASHFMYNQGMATMALCEAAGLSGDPILRDVAQKGLDFIVKAQATKGGWNYRGDPQGESDTSLSAWQVQALHAGREACLNVPKEALAKALEMYKQATQAEGYVQYSVGSVDKADVNRVSLCGVSLMMRQLLGEETQSPMVRKMADAVMKDPYDTMRNTKRAWGDNWKPNLTKNDDPARAKYDPYMMYFCTYGMFFLGGKDWDLWHEAMKKGVCQMQQSDGVWWTNDTWTYCGGTTYSTALSILTLQVYYRIQCSQ